MSTIRTTTQTQPTLSSRLHIIIAHRPLVAFFILAFAFAWLTVLPMTLSHNVGVGVLPYDLPDALALVLYLVASFIGPTIAAVLVTATIEGRAGVRQLLRRCIQWRARPRWYAAALGTNLLVWLLAYSVLMGPELLAAAFVHWQLLVVVFLPYVAFGLLIPAIGEEPGWRGFALPRMQQQFGPLRASLILGMVHGVWHFPALFTRLLGPFTLDQLIPFVITAALATIIYTWIYNRTQGSILLAMLMHASGNAATGWLTALIAASDLHEPDQGWPGFLARTGWINVAGYGVVAVLVVVLTRGRLGANVSSGQAEAKLY